jgi:hypothetical protein
MRIPRAVTLFIANPLFSKHGRLSVRLTRNLADKRNVTEEFPSLRAPLRLLNSTSALLTAQYRTRFPMPSRLAVDRVPTDTRAALSVVAGPLPAVPEHLKIFLGAMDRCLRSSRMGLAWLFPKYMKSVKI